MGTFLNEDFFKRYEKMLENLPVRQKYLCNIGNICWDEILKFLQFNSYYSIGITECSRKTFENPKNDKRYSIIN